MRIGEVAAQSGVSVDTLRFYERRGVLAPPRRRPSGYRSYGPGTVARVRFVKQLQTIGLSLDDIGQLLKQVDGGNANCEDACPQLDQTLERLDQRIAELSATRDRLAGVLSGCRAGQCGIAEGLSSCER